MIASDIDGTLLDYNYIPGQLPAVNWPLLRLLAERTDTLRLVSNQGGLPWGVMGKQRKDGRAYPKPADFVGRFVHLVGALALHGVQVPGLYVCVYHPAAPADAVHRAASGVGDLLFSAMPGGEFHIAVFGDVEYRKPSPAMLVAAGATCYYGDSDEDAAAAEAAGIEFVRVERFHAAT